MVWPCPTLHSKQQLMKKVLQLIASAFLCGTSYLATAQTFCGRIVQIESTATSYTIGIELQGSRDFGIGSGNLVVDYDRAALADPTLVTTSLPTNFPGTPFRQYNTSVTDPTPGLSFNIELLLVDAGKTLTSAQPLQLATISFSRKPGVAIKKDFSFVYDGSSRGTVQFVDDEATQVFATSPACLVGLSADVSLPVELVSFDAIAIVSNALLSWTTAAEVNNHGFSVEHSWDGTSFQTIGWVDAKGSDSEYAHVHDAPGAGTHYYRLRQRDLDGAEELSDVRAVTFEADVSETKLLRAWPNPVSADLFVQLTAPANAELVDALGRVVWQGRLTSEGSIDMGAHADGIYFLKAEGYQPTRVVVRQ